MPKIVKRSINRSSIVLRSSTTQSKLPLNAGLQHRSKARSQPDNIAKMLHPRAVPGSDLKIWKILSKKQSSATSTGRPDPMKDDLARVRELSKIGYTLQKLGKVLPSNPKTNSKLQISTQALRVLLGTSSLKSAHGVKTPRVNTSSLNISIIEGLHAVNLSLYDLRVFFEPVRQDGNNNPTVSNHDSAAKSHGVRLADDVDPTHCNPRVWNKIPYDNTGNQLKQHIRMHSSDDRAWKTEIVRCDQKNKKKETICVLKPKSGGRTLAARKNLNERYVIYANPDHNEEKKFLKNTLPTIIQAKNAQCLDVRTTNKKQKDKREHKKQPDLFDFVYETNSEGRFEITAVYPADDDVVQ